MEKWDILDRFGSRTGRTVTKGGELRDGEYHLVVHAWIISSNNGKILIQKRPEHLEFAPGIWAVAGGSAIHGENSMTAVCREVKEELGIVINPVIDPVRYVNNNSITDIWVVKSDVNLKDVKIQEEEVTAVKWVTNIELKTMIQNGEFYKSSYKEYYELLSANICLL